MNHPRLRLVVAGMPALSAALEQSQRFDHVFAVASTGGLRDLIAGGLNAGKDELVFVFADNLTVDTPQTPLPVLIHKLTANGYKVIVAAVTPNAHDLVSAYPSAGLLEGPFTVNGTLGAISGTGVGVIPPTQDGFTPIDPHTGPIAPPAATQSAAPTAPAPAPGGWMTPDVEPPVDQAPPPQAPQAPAQPQAPFHQAPPQQAPAQEFTAPTFPAPEQAPQAPQHQPVMPDPNAPLGGYQQPADPHAPQGQPGRRSLSAFAEDQPAAPSAPAAPSGWETPPEHQAVPSAWETAAHTDQNPQGWESVPADAGWQGAQSNGPVARAGAYQAEHALPDRRGYVITVTVPKGGAGKSSLTLNLAAYMGLRMRALGKTVCIIDTNFQQADIGKYLNAYNPNITDLVRDQGLIHRDRIATKLLHRPDLNMSALLGPATPVDANPLWINARLYSQCLEALRQLYDYVFIDTPVAELYHDIFRDFALPEADYILVPVAPNYPTIMNTDAWLGTVTTPRLAGGAGVDPDKVGIVLNRAQEDIGCSEEEVRVELAQWQFIGAIPETKEWQRANNLDEIVATKNYAELNEAFARILYASTGEESLLEGMSTLTPTKESVTGRLKKLLGR